jgi:hypothetical protein
MNHLHPGAGSDAGLSAFNKGRYDCRVPFSRGSLFSAMAGRVATCGARRAVRANAMNNMDIVSFAPPFFVILSS